jgi:hypothetical protein
LQSFAAQDGAAREEYSTRVEFVPGQWCQVKIDLPWGFGDGSVPLRFDPVDRAGIIDIASVTLRSNATGEILWCASTRGGFDDLVIRGTCLRLPHPRLLRLLSYAADPQVHLPELAGDSFQEPLGLEVWIRFDGTLESINAALETWNKGIAHREEAAAPNDLGVSEESSGPESVSSIRSNDHQIALALYSAGESGYTEDRGIHLKYAAQRWSQLHIALEHGLGARQLRLDPLPTSGLVEIAAMSLTSPISGEVLWRADGSGGLDMLEISGSAVRIPHARLARILSYGEDPKVYLPAFAAPHFDGPLQLEIWLRTETGPEAMRRGISDLAAASSQVMQLTGQVRRFLEHPVSGSPGANAEGELPWAAAEREVSHQGEKLAALQEEKDVSKETLNSLRSELDEARKALALTQSKLGSRDFEFREVSEELNSTSQLLALRTSQLESLRNELTSITGQLADRAAELAESRRDLAHAKDEMALPATELATLAEELASIKRELARANDVIAARASEVAAARMDLAGSQAESNARTTELNEAARKLTATKTELSLRAHQLEEWKARFARGQTMSKELAHELRGAEQKVSSLQAELRGTGKSSWQRLWSRLGNVFRMPPAAQEDAPAEQVPGSHTFWIDHPNGPSLEHQTIAVSGWVFGLPNVTCRSIRAVANGHVTFGEYGRKRADVAAAFPDREDAGYAGFYIELELPQGLHEIFLQVKSDKDRWETFCSFQHEVRDQSGAGDGLMATANGGWGSPRGS